MTVEFTAGDFLLFSFLPGNVRGNAADQVAESASLSLLIIGIVGLKSFMALPCGSLHFDLTHDLYLYSYILHRPVNNNK